MGSLFFSPQGRIGAGPFWQGVIILLIIGCGLNVLAAYGPPAQFLPIALVAALISLFLIYPSLCVYGKRLHDAGQSAWWFVVILIGGGIVSSILGNVAAGMLLGDQMTQLQTQIQESTAGGEIGPEFFMLLRRSIQLQLVPSLGSSVLVSLVIAFIVGSLKSDPAENRFGPPTTGAAGAARAA
jgi:uncharacterized membrane protein YhaH (DUF805 family)